MARGRGRGGGKPGRRTFTSRDQLGEPPPSGQYSEIQARADLVGFAPKDLTRMMHYGLKTARTCASGCRFYHVQPTTPPVERCKPCVSLLNSVDDLETSHLTPTRPYPINSARAIRFVDPILFSSLARASCNA
eukprot:607923-Pyramimonas_sp.AAC.1